MQRLDVIYLALQSTRAQELFVTIAKGDLMPAARNGAVRDLAKIVDQALAEEIARRTREGGA